MFPHPPLVNGNTMCLSSPYVFLPFLICFQQSPKLICSLILNEWSSPIDLVLPRKSCAQVQYTHKYTHEPVFSSASHQCFAVHVYIIYVCACIVNLEDHCKRYSSGCHPSNLLFETASFRSPEFTSSARLADSKPRRIQSSPSPGTGKASTRNHTPFTQ